MQDFTKIIENMNLLIDFVGGASRQMLSKSVNLEVSY